MIANMPKDPFGIDAWFAALDRYAHIPFMPEGREQPRWPDEATFLKLSEETFADWRSNEDEGAFRDL